jgi:hypothetical protein
VGKRHLSKSFISTSRPLELIHLDLFGPTTYDNVGGSRFGLIIVDDYSRYTWVFLLKSKDETHVEFIKWDKQAQRSHGQEIMAVRMDNGSEFKNYTMQDFVEDEGIKHQFSTPYTPQMNGVVERKNRTIIVMARTMLDEFKSPHTFWGEAIATAVHASNRLFLRPIYDKTPYELLTGNKPNISYFRVFGFKCFIKNKKKKLVNSNLEPLKVLLLVMRTNPTPIGITTSPPNVLNYLVMWNSMRIMAPKRSKFLQVM